MKFRDIPRVLQVGHFLEPVPHYNKSEAEKVFQGENNTWIVFGRDRPNHKLSGYGRKRSYSGGIN